MERKPLTQQHCVPCEGGMPPLTRNMAEKLLAETSGWALPADAKSISREFVFKDSREALAFVNKVGELAESEDHHPDIHWRRNTVKLDLSTHAIKGLSQNDFILAAKINGL